MRKLHIVLMLILLVFITACGKEEKHNIHFDTNGGGSIESTDFNDVEDILLPEDPTRDGYEFGGWYLDQECTTMFQIRSLQEDQIDDDLVLYAKWSEVLSDLTIQLQAIYNLAVTADEFDGTYEEWLDTVKGPQGIPGESGQTPVFTVDEDVLMWKYEGDSTWIVLFDFSDLYGSAGLSAYELYVQENPDYTGSLEDWINEFFSTTEETIYEVAFNPHNALSPFSQQVTSGDKALRPKIPLKKGYTFTGWYIENTNIEWVFEGFVVSEDINLEAKWVLDQLTISFEENGGSEVIDIKQDYDTIVLEPKEPIRDGYTFSGWYIDESFLEPYVFTTMPMKDITIYAKWTVNQYTLSYAIYADYDPVNDITLGLGETIDSISMGAYHSSALTTEGKLYLWGENGSGQLGYGTSTYSNMPNDISSQFNLFAGEKIQSVSLGAYHSSALTTENRLFMWGNNNSGQLGNGFTLNSDTPIDITSQFNLNEGETIHKVSLGAYHSSALTTDNRLFTWGRNNSGQLGNGSTANSLVPYDTTAQFSLNEGEVIQDVSMGEDHSSIITSEGRLFMWGNNEFGQLGNGDTVDSNNPIEIENSEFSLNQGEVIQSVSLGKEHSSALTSEGRLFMWGSNESKQLGIVTAFVHMIIPIEITSRFNLEEGEVITSVIMRGRYSSAFTSQGRLFMWGENTHGQLGDGTTISSIIPVDITLQFELYTGDALRMVALGSSHSSVITTDGHLLMWGRNIAGELGTVSGTNSNTPILNRMKTAFSIEQTVYDYSQTIDKYLPTREGYTFDGWYEDVELTILFTPSTMPSADTVLYARWVEES